MPDRWIGIVVMGDAVTIVDVTVPDDDGPLTMQADMTWPLQKGDRPLAYNVMSERISNYVDENNISTAVVKESAVSLGGTKKAHLLSAELRGVVLASLADKVQTSVRSKAATSKTFGSRKVDEYLVDAAFWDDQIDGSLRAGSREAVLLLLAARKG